MILYIVATPIGNLEDISFRALRVLKEVDLILAEDTRHTRKLLTHFQIPKIPISFFESKEEKKIPFLISQLKEGKSMALVTDAGTPAISDPGFRLVRRALEAGIKVIPLPGPCAAICAMQASGLPSDHFLFAGFLPEKEGKRKKTIQSLKEFPHTFIIYLSPWKAKKQLAELAEILGSRPVCLGREMTKLHEEFWRGDLLDLAKAFNERIFKGEMTLVVAKEEKIS